MIPSFLLCLLVASSSFSLPFLLVPLCLVLRSFSPRVTSRFVSTFLLPDLFSFASFLLDSSGRFLCMFFYRFLTFRLASFFMLFSQFFRSFSFWLGFLFCPVHCCLRFLFALPYSCLLYLIFSLCYVLSRFLVLYPLFLCRLVLSCFILFFLVVSRSFSFRPALSCYVPCFPFLSRSFSFGLVLVVLSRPFSAAFLLSDLFLLFLVMSAVFFCITRIRELSQFVF